jgi:hypothetical protein
MCIERSAGGAARTHKTKVKSLIFKKSLGTPLRKQVRRSLLLLRLKLEAHRTESRAPAATRALAFDSSRPRSVSAAPQPHPRPLIHLNDIT